MRSEIVALMAIPTYNSWLMETLIERRRQSHLKSFTPHCGDYFTCAPVVKVNLTPVTDATDAFARIRSAFPKGTLFTKGSQDPAMLDIRPTQGNLQLIKPRQLEIGRDFRQGILHSLQM